MQAPWDLQTERLPVAAPTSADRQTVGELADLDSVATTVLPQVGRHRREDGPRPTAPRFRPELQGLRALACGLVVVYHVWIGRVSGGVDVFFVVTGFLLTVQLVGAAERGRIDLVAHWGRTLRRLVPTTAVVLLATVAAGIVIIPESRWPQTVREVVASALFAQNWRLAADATDYYAAHNTQSVVQHLWSLAIQGQFSLVFPVLVVLLTLLAHRLRLPVRAPVLAALVLLTAGSLVYSAHLTATAQQLAYFHSGTRLWEFTTGGVLGLLITRVHLPSALRVVLGWTGVVALVSCGLVLDVAGGFPGYYALWPVLAACLVLLAERTDGPLGVDRLLSAAPLQYLGRISFPLYLWHWPVLLLFLLAARREEPGPLGGIVVVALSLLLAAATDRFVDLPLQRAPRRPWSGYRSGAIALVAVLVVAFAWQNVTTARARPSGVVGDAGHPGAVALAPGGPRPVTAPPIPPAVAAYEDWVPYEQGCRTSPAHPGLQRCTWVEAPQPDAPTVVVVGDSHMQQFLPALAPVARERGWRVDTLIRPGCPFSTSSDSNVGEVDCVSHNRAAIDEILETRPTAVVAQASRNVRVGRTEETPAGFVEAWRALDGAGVPVLAVRDNPRFGYPPPSCTDTYGRGAPDCDVPRADLYAPDPPITRIRPPDTVRYLDLADSLCAPQLCRPEVGNVTVYLDDNHLTATYSASLAPVVGPRLAEVVDRGPGRNGR